MARRYTLTAALLVAVLLGHALVLQWLAWQAGEASALPLMVTPMYTRMLQPEAPAPPAAKLVERARPRPRLPVIQSVAASTPDTATPTERLPDPVASVPASETPMVVATLEAAQEAASAPSSAADSVAPSTMSTDTATPTPDRWPTDTRLTYRLGGYYRGELHGSARVEWLREGERYQTRIDIDLGLASLVMTSQGQVAEQELLPSAYEETRIGKRRSVLMQDKIVLSDGRQVPRPEGVQDTASQFVQLGHRFASGQWPLEVGRSVTFWMARPGGVDQWTYDIIDKEVLQTPQLGAVEAFHLKPRPLTNPRGIITAEMWFAPTLQYLPVRILVNAGDARLDLLVDKIEQR